MLSFSIDGLDDIQNALQDLPTTIQANILQVFTDALDIAKGVADDGCPVVTGTLKNGNGVEVSQDSSGAVTGYLYNSVDYAPDVIFGTRYQTAQDFFTPALQAGSDYIASQNVLETSN